MKKVVFRADGSLEVGYGHFIRTLGIASIIKGEFICSYATVKPSSYQISEINKVCNELIILENAENHYDDFLKMLNGDEIVVIDDYNFERTQQIKIRNKGCKLIYIDDHNDKSYVCDALINNIPGFSESSFRREKYTKLYLGIDYALLRNEFFNSDLRHVEKRKSEIFLAFGGADKYNISLKILKFLFLIDPSYKVNLLIGDAYTQLDELANFDRLKIFKNISAFDVAKLMASANICIVPASSLLNEASSIGCKLITGFFADNQIQPYKYFVKNNLAIGIGDYRNLEFKHFRERLFEAFKAEYLIGNQSKLYRNQQEVNLKNIFYNI